MNVTLSLKPLEALALYALLKEAGLKDKGLDDASVVHVARMVDDTCVTARVCKGLEDSDSKAADALDNRSRDAVLSLADKLQRAAGDGWTEVRGQTSYERAAVSSGRKRRGFKVRPQSVASF